MLYASCETGYIQKVFLVSVMLNFILNFSCTKKSQTEQKQRNKQTRKKKKPTQKPKTKPKKPGSTGNMLNSAYAEGDDYIAT